MTTFPLPTLAATITAAGISAPSYADIYTSLQASMAAIYGSDVYIDPDSQDGQMLAVFAQAQDDTNNTVIAEYNARSPSTAQGAGLSSVVKINGLARMVPSNSTVDLIITGTAGTIINDGIAQDTNGNQWLLPSPITIDNTGQIVATATSAVSGNITAASGTVNQIATPTIGWQTVLNNAAAVPGAPVETDAALRVRQATSTSLPAQSIIDSIAGNLENIAGVQQVKVFENDTNLPDANGLPEHSIACVVEGGNATTIAQTIELKKSPGCFTYGSTSILVSDPVGLPIKISFFVPTQITILVDISIKALAGYTSTIGTQIVTNILNYINGLGINANNGLLSLSSLYEPAYDTDAPKTYNITSLTIARSPGSPSAADIAIAFNELPIIVAGNVSLIVS